MIHFLVTAAHRYTLKELPKWDGMPAFRVVPYERAFRARRLGGGTWIFADLDRLDYWQLELAARLYRVIRDQGARVLNDPAKALQRVALLTRLNELGINDFRVWRVEDGERPDRFPVFLRTQTAHRGPLTDLLSTEEDVEAAIREALGNGYPLRELILVEYCGEPIADGIFRKRSMFRVGKRFIATVSAHEDCWNAKYGTNGIAAAAHYADDLEHVRNTTYEEEIGRAFDAAQIEYGRADFAVVRGRVQIYEINTNPFIRRIPSGHPYPTRYEADDIFRARFVDAFRTIDVEGPGSLGVSAPELVQQRKLDRYCFGTRWSI